MKIEKLPTGEGVKLSSTTAGQRELIREYRNKLNEVIDFANALTSNQTCKTEACTTHVLPPVQMEDIPGFEGTIKKLDGLSIREPETVCRRLDHWHSDAAQRQCGSIVHEEPGEPESRECTCDGASHQWQADCPPVEGVSKEKHSTGCEHNSIMYPKDVYPYCMNCLEVVVKMPAVSNTERAEQVEALVEPQVCSGCGMDMAEETELHLMARLAYEHRDEATQDCVCSCHSRGKLCKDCKRHTEHDALVEKLIEKYVKRQQSRKDWTYGGILRDFAKELADLQKIGQGESE